MTKFPLYRKTETGDLFRVKDQGPKSDTMLLRKEVNGKIVSGLIGISREDFKNRYEMVSE